MRSFIQLTDVNNIVLQSLPLGDLSNTTTVSFRVWNNKPQYGGIGALDGLKLKMYYPPKQGIKTLINSNAIKVRCTYSGKYSETITSNFQSFPLFDAGFDRLEPNCYNEYEIQFDFSNLTTAQKIDVDGVDMEFNVVVTYDTEYLPLSLPGYRSILSDSVVRITGLEKTIKSDSAIV